jgi:hypothetical protein
LTASLCSVFPFRADRRGRGRFGGVRAAAAPFRTH